MKRLMLFALALPLAGCIEGATIPLAVTPPEALVVHAEVRGDSLVLDALVSEAPGYAVGAWFDTDQNDDTGGRYNGGPDYASGTYGAADRELWHLFHDPDGARTYVAPVALRSTSRGFTLAVALADLADDGALDWGVEVYRDGSLVALAGGSTAPLVAAR